MKFSVDVETQKFNDHMKKFIKGANIEVGLGLKKFAFDLVRRIVLKNPVDTGRSRGAWYVGLEKLGGNIGDIPIHGPGGKGSDTYSTKEMARGKMVGGFKDRTGKSYKQKWIEIINGVNYITFLEYGSSQQSPYGMVRVSMRELRQAKLPEVLKVRLQKEWKRI